jgi:hypothetical protein
MKISQASGPEAAKTLKFSALFWYRKAGVSQNSTAIACDTTVHGSQSQPAGGGMNPSWLEYPSKNTDLIKVIQ